MAALESEFIIRWLRPHKTATEKPKQNQQQERNEYTNKGRFQEKRVLFAPIYEAVDGGRLKMIALNWTAFGDNNPTATATATATTRSQLTAQSHQQEELCQTFSQLPIRICMRSLSPFVHYRADAQRTSLATACHSQPFSVSHRSYPTVDRNVHRINLQLAFMHVLISTINCNCFKFMVSL